MHGRRARSVIRGHGLGPKVLVDVGVALGHAYRAVCGNRDWIAFRLGDRSHLPYKGEDGHCGETSHCRVERAPRRTAAPRTEQATAPSFPTTLAVVDFGKWIFGSSRSLGWEFE